MPSSHPLQDRNQSTDRLDFHAGMGHSRMRGMNLALILACLHDHPRLSRSQLAGLTGLTKAGITSLIKELIDGEYIREIGSVSGNMGRPSISLELNPQAGCIIGAEIGVDFISVILTDFSAHILWREFLPITPSAGQENILYHAMELITRAVEQAGQTTMAVLGIGLGVPGLVDRDSGTLLFAPNLKWRVVPLRQMLEDRFHLPVYVDNEANMAALGESYFGAGQGSDFVVYVSSGVGIGGGIVLNQQILTGAHGFGGEIGHMTLDPHGLPCNCGSRGCWETLASQNAVFRRVSQAIQNGASSELTGSSWTMEQVLAAARHGDDCARQALRETGVYMGIGIASLINALNPQVVVFGGILSLAHEFVLPAIRQEIERRALVWSRQAVEIKLSAHGPDSCVLGSVAAVYHRILADPVMGR